MPAPIKPTITYEDFAKLDLRIATVLSAEAHPNADRLLKLQVDLGFEQRQVCAGIRAYYPEPQALVGKQVLIVANLAPRTIRGEVSNGMILAASKSTGAPEGSPEGTPEQVVDVIVLQPSKDVPPGSTVS